MPPGPAPMMNSHKMNSVTAMVVGRVRERLEAATGLCAFHELAQNGLGRGGVNGGVRGWLGAATGLCASRHA